MNAPETLVGRLSGIRVAVIGDAMLDSYLDGYAGRLCREAPVPIVSVSDRRDAPGGAANTAANVRSLGGEVRLLGIVGDDPEGDRLRQALADVGVPAEDLLTGPRRATLAKQRVLADGQLLLRFDTGSTEPPEEELAGLLAERLDELHAWADAVVVSDYAYGVVSDSVTARLAELQMRAPRPLVADAKDPRRLAPTRPAAVKPNYAEACELLGLEPLYGTDRRAAQVADQAERLGELTGAANVVVTLDGDGSVLLRPGEPPYRTFATAVSNDHAAGAGDTFAACLALGLAAGIEPPTAVELASAASSVAVGKRGTATCGVDELLATVSGGPVVSDLEALARRVALEKRRGRRVVFTNGCFDILHSGHVAYLAQARELGDVLVVAVNGDASVRRLKGDGRPVNQLADRLQVLAALGSVDYVTTFDDDTPQALIEALRPDVVAKGGDYSEETLPEAELVRRLGGEIRILPFVADRSTSRIIERIGAGYGAGSGAAPVGAGSSSP